MSALRLARAATGREQIVKFAGCYHGHADGLLVEAGSGVATLGVPASPGVPRPPRPPTPWSLPYNDLAAVQRAFDAHGRGDRRRHHRGRAPPTWACVPPGPGLLRGAARVCCDRHGALLVLDEVMTGFRCRRPAGWGWRTMHARPDHLREGDRRRAACRRLRRPGRADAHSWRPPGRCTRPARCRGTRWRWRRGWRRCGPAPTRSTRR